MGTYTTSFQKLCDIRPLNQNWILNFLQIHNVAYPLGYKSFSLLFYNDKLIASIVMFYTKSYRNLNYQEIWLNNKIMEMHF